MFTSPDSGQLVGMDSRRRTFGGLLRRMVVFRDDVCRTPWCDAPIRHADHVTPAAEGGETEWSNASGLCAACNYAKERPGWKHEATAEDLTVSTPSGEGYEASTPPFVTKLSNPPLSNAPPAGTNESDEDDSHAADSGVDVVDRPDLSLVEVLFEEIILRDTG